MRVYIESRQRNQATQAKEIAQIFPDDAQRELLVKLLKQEKLKHSFRG